MPLPLHSLVRVHMQKGPAGCGSQLWRGLKALNRVCPRPFDMPGHYMGADFFTPML